MTCWFFAVSSVDLNKETLNEKMPTEPSETAEKATFSQRLRFETRSALPKLDFSAVPNQSQTVSSTGSVPATTLTTTTRPPQLNTVVVKIVLMIT